MSSKNPWESPNDDNVWNKKENFSFLSDFEKSFKKLFGGGGKNNGPPFFSIGAIVSIFFVLYVLSGFYQVQHDERGVVLRFGRWVRTVGPGLQYILPYPFESVILQKSTNIKQIDIGAFFKNSKQEESLMLTGDSNLANISFSVLWRIKEGGVEEYLFNAKSPEITVKAVSESVMREVVGQNVFSYVQTDGRGEIQQKVRHNLQSLMDEYKMGIEILRIELQRVEPPISVVDSFRDVERAQAEQQSEKNKAEAYDRDTRARIRGAIAEKINIGEAKKRSIIEGAKGDVARFLSAHSQHKLAPDIVPRRLYIETMRDVLSKVDKIIIDGDTKSVPYLPLTELRKGKNVQENKI